MTSINAYSIGTNFLQSERNYYEQLTLIHSHCIYYIWMPGYYVHSLGTLFHVMLGVIAAVVRIIKGGRWH